MKKINFLLLLFFLLLPFQVNAGSKELINANNEITLLNSSWQVRYFDDDPDYKVDNSTNINNICSNSNFRKPAKLVGVVVTYIKILVPIFIILFGAIDFYKAITSQKDDGIKKAAKSVAIRAIAGVVIFLLPGLVQMVLNMVNEWSDYKNNWCCCTECILNSDCDVNSCSSGSCHIEGTN